MFVLHVQVVDNMLQVAQKCRDSTNPLTSAAAMGMVSHDGMPAGIVYPLPPSFQVS